MDSVSVVPVEDRVGSFLWYRGCDLLLIIFSFCDEFKFCIQKLLDQDSVTMFDRPGPSCSEVG